MSVTLIIFTFTYNLLVEQVEDALLVALLVGLELEVDGLGDLGGSSGCAGGVGHSGAVVVGDLPVAVDLLPHVGEAGVDGLAVVGGAGHESVHAGVEVSIIAGGLNVVGGDGAVGELLEEVDEVLLGGVGVADELGGDGGEERQLGGGVEGSNLLVVLGLEGAVPAGEVLLGDGVVVLVQLLLGIGLGSAGEGRAVVVHNLPVAVNLAPHVGEAGLDSLAGILGSDHESVHAGVEVGVLAVALNVVGGDGAGRELLEELHEVLLGLVSVLDELGRDSGEERQVLGGVEGGDLLELLGLEGVVPPEFTEG
jgi:hypothetical protein